MDLENSGDVLGLSEPSQQEESVMEKEVVSKLETPEESTGPENPPAADGEIEQLPVNGHDTDLVNLTETEKPIVIETEMLSEGEAEMEVEDSLATEKPGMELESMAVTPPEPDESELENTQPQQQSENDPDPLPEQPPLADISPKPEPEKPAESVTEAEAEEEEQTLPEPEVVQQTENIEAPNKEEKVPDQEETETKVETPMDTEPEEVVQEIVEENDVAVEPNIEVEEEKPAETVNMIETVLVTEASPEEPAETEKLVPEVKVETEKIPETEMVADVSLENPAKTEIIMQTALEAEVEAVTQKLAETGLESVTPEKPAETEILKESVPPEPVTLMEETAAQVESVKLTEKTTEVEPEKSIKPETLKGAETAAEVEGVKSEAEPQKEEETAPASGSLSFALMQQEQTKDALRTSRTLVVLRGLPGSGKSFLARAIAETYKEHCTVFCADDHDVKPESPEASADGHKALDEAVVACCSAGAVSSVLVVVDDTNHTQDRLAQLGEIAEQHHLVAIFLEPQTEWSRDPAQLKEKTKRGLEEAQLEAMRGPHAEMSIPLYFGWFLLSSVQEKVRCTSMDFLKTLDTLDAFKKHLTDFTGKAEKEVDLEQYFQTKGALHCTTKFCNYGKVEGAKEYAENQAVRDLYGSVSELSLSALFVTPCTVGARVSLTEEQLVLWPADAEKQADVPTTAASLPQGSRAHVTLGCAEGVEPVQTGLDLLDILALQQDGQQGELVEEMELGSLTYYGSGRWFLSLREPICAPACFSSYYGRKEVEPTKKEPERRRKQKCTIL